MTQRAFSLLKQSDGHSITFDAMASPCEVLIDSDDPLLASEVAQAVTQEVWRIEDKFSRYDPNSLCSQINHGDGQAISIDNETYLLLNFAQQCYELSDGLFDISSGVLGRVWQFDGSDKIPSAAQVVEVLVRVGWPRIDYDEQQIIMPKAMEIDFGGIGKEYAVDRAILSVAALTDEPVLVNLGGDLCASAPRHNGQPWQVGIEHPGLVDKPSMMVSLYRGALATSGDAKRFLLSQGKRYSHILNAKTGWPIEQAPASITVAAQHCVEAGVFATLAMLQGENAEDFLQAQQIKHWVIRHPSE